MDWVDPTCDNGRWRALLNTVMYLRVPYNEGNFTSCGTISFSSTTLLQGVSCRHAATTVVR